MYVQSAEKVEWCLFFFAVFTKYMGDKRVQAGYKNSALDMVSSYTTNLYYARQSVRPIASFKSHHMTFQQYPVWIRQQIESCIGSCPH
jgi:hypothetical protein